MKRSLLLLLLLLLLCPLLGSACSENESVETPLPSRQSKIPADAVKMRPKDDAHPPILHAQGWEKPQPVPGPINTAGGEDAPFITPDGTSFFFFFTPNVSLPAEEQLKDQVTGIYEARKTDGEWGDPQRVILNDDIALDGCPFVRESTLWFCSVRPGYQSPHWFTAEYQDGTWTNWQAVAFDPEYKVGELHITADGKELYYHSDRPGTKGLYDIWVSRKSGEEWGEPENVTAVNTAGNESRPFLTADGQELWFTRDYQGTPAIYRSLRQDGKWGQPELILSQFAGEPTLDPAGNVYFVHHFFKEGVMIEVDIYVAYKK